MTQDIPLLQLHSTLPRGKYKNQVVEDLILEDPKYIKGLTRDQEYELSDDVLDLVNLELSYYPDEIDTPDFYPDQEIYF